LVIFTDCGRRRRRTDNRSARRERTVTPKEPEIKEDTVFFVVPTEPETVPDVTPKNPVNPSDEQDLVIVVPSNKVLKPVVHKDNLPAPPQIIFSRPNYSHTRQDYIERFEITGDMKDLIIACDYDSKTVRNNTVALVSASGGNFNLGQICDIFDFCLQNWSYVNDPISRDYYAKASETLRNGLNGDCDDFAILLCSMILSIGGEARISFAYGNDGGHAFTEVNIGKTNRTEVERYLKARYGYTGMWHKEDSNGNWWLNLDWQAHYPGGQYYKYNRGTMFNIIQNIYQNL
jgi:transglutaminase-like putative cysteine protease